MWIVLQIERDIFRLSGKQNYSLAQCMCISYLIEYVRIAPRHVSN